MSKEIGVKGEALAKEYLINKGYKILEINFKNKIGGLLREND